MKKIFILPILIAPCVASASISIFYDTTGQCDKFCNMIPDDPNSCCPQNSVVTAGALVQKIEAELALRGEDFNGFTWNNIEIFNKNGDFVLTPDLARENDMGGKQIVNDAAVKCKSGLSKNFHDSCVDLSAVYVDDNGFVIDPDDVEFGRGAEACLPIRDFQVHFHPIPTNNTNNLPNPPYGYFGHHWGVGLPPGITEIGTFVNQQSVYNRYNPDPELQGNAGYIQSLACNQNNGCITLYHCGDAAKWGVNKVGWYNNPNCEGEKITQLSDKQLPTIDGYTLRGYYGYTFNYMGNPPGNGTLAPLYIIPDLVTGKSTTYGATYAKRFVHDLTNDKLPLGEANLKVVKCPIQFPDNHIPDDTLTGIIVDVFGAWARTPTYPYTVDMTIFSSTSGAYDAGDVKYDCKPGYHVRSGAVKYDTECIEDTVATNITVRFKVPDGSGCSLKSSAQSSDTCTVGDDVYVSDVPGQDDFTCDDADQYKPAGWRAYDNSFYSLGADIPCTNTVLGNNDSSTLYAVICDCDNLASAKCTEVCGSGAPGRLEEAFTVDGEVSGEN